MDRIDARRIIVPRSAERCVLGSHSGGRDSYTARGSDILALAMSKVASGRVSEAVVSRGAAAELTMIDAQRRMGGGCRVDFPYYAASGHLAKDTSPVYKAKDLGIGGQRAIFLYVTKREILFSEFNKRGVIGYQLSEYRQNGGPSRNRGHSAVSSHGRRGFKVGDDLRKLQARSSAATWHRPNREFIVLIHQFCTALLSHSLSYHRRPDLALITTISY